AKRFGSSQQLMFSVINQVERACFKSPNEQNLPNEILEYT
ncbi:38238_t:CDS:1, partial [Gigaspora margarita]